MQVESPIFAGGWQGVETGTHNGKFSDWSYDFYIKSFGRDFLTSLAKSVMETGRQNLDAIPLRDCISVFDSLNFELNRKYADAQQQRTNAMQDLKSRNEDWARLQKSNTGNSGTNPSFGGPVSQKVNGPTNVFIANGQYGYWYYVNPYCLSADGWLLQVGTAMDLPAPGVSGWDTWRAGYTGITSIKNFNPTDASSWGDPNVIFARAETYSRLRAFEYALFLRLEAVTKIQAMLKAGNLAGIKAAASETVSSPFDFWTVTELPNAVQYVNPLLALNPITLQTVVDVPFTPDPATVTQDKDGSLTVNVDGKYDSLDALQAFRSGITPLQSIFVQPRNYLTPGQTMEEEKKKSPLLMLAAAGLALYLAVKQ